MDITSCVLLTTIFLILTRCLCNWLFRTGDYWTSRGIPCVPGALPIFGNTSSMVFLQDNIITYCLKVHNAYRGSSMVGLQKFGRPALLIRDPDLVRTVLETKFHSFQRNENQLDPKMDPLFAQDPLFTIGQHWKTARVVFVAAFTAKRLKYMSLVVTNVCRKLENYLDEKIRDKDSLEIEGKNLFSRYSVEVGAGVMFGVDGNSFADDHRGTFLESMDKTTTPSVIKAMKHLAILTVPKLGKILKVRFVPVSVDRFFRNAVNHLADQRLKDGDARSDALQVMLDMETSGRILRDQTHGHAFSFIMESYETSRLTLSAVAYCVAKYEVVQSHLREEVDTVLEKYGGQLTYEAVNEMTYMSQVMKEVMRLYPVGGAMSKVCTKKCRLEASDGLAVDVEPGTAILISISGLHSEPQFWENPEEFRPERFDRCNVEGRHKFVHLPFGRGPRICPGQRLAILQVKAAMATILRNYRVELSPKVREPIRTDPKHFLNTPVGGFWFRLRRLKDN